MFRYATLAFCFVLGSTALVAENKEQGRLENCGVVMQEVLDVPDNIPQELLEKAECVIVIPSMTKAAMGIGGSYGRGAMVCRSGKAFNGPWGAPAMYAIEGGSFGLQLGAESTDVVLLVMNPRGVDALLSSKVKLGGNASAAAGPKGRNLEASTDATMRSEILSYSRARGLFAGVSLEGTSIRPDNDANEDVYGRKLTARQIVMGPGHSRAGVRPSLWSTCSRRTRRTTTLVVQDDSEQRVVDLEAVRVVDESQPLEFLHEEINPRSRRADHRRQRLLGDRRDGPHRLVLLAVARQQQERAGEPLLAGVEQLVDQILFDPDVPRQHVRDEPIRQRVLLVQEAHHLRLVHEQHRAVCHRRRRPHADGLPGQTAFTEELAGPQHRHYGFAARFRQHRQLDVALPDVEDVIAGVALLEDDRVAWILDDRLLLTPADSRKA